MRGSTVYNVYIHAWRQLFKLTIWGQSDTLCFRIRDQCSVTAGLTLTVPTMLACEKHRQRNISHCIIRGILRHDK